MGKYIRTAHFILTAAALALIAFGMFIALPATTLEQLPANSLLLFVMGTTLLLSVLTVELALIAKKAKRDTKFLAKAIKDERAKESRHEYFQERALERLEERISRVELTQTVTNQHVSNADSTSTQHKVDILFATSNGAGLGHLTRALSIAKALSDGTPAAILTLSTAYERAAGNGIPVYYFPSAEKAPSSQRYWNDAFRNYFAQLLADLRPSVVVFDGVAVYQGITDACRAFGIQLVWLQRGCWKAEVEARSTTRHNAQSVCDHVIVPGDYGCPETVDCGPGVSTDHVSPIVLVDKQQLSTVTQAKEALGLDHDKHYILVNLGGSLIGDTRALIDAVTKATSKTNGLWKVALLRSPLSDELKNDSNVEVLEYYPIAKHLRAFDVVVAAAGYNSVQEVVVAQVPSVLVPNLNTRTDDQLKRAENAATDGWSLLGTSQKQLEDNVTSLIENESQRTALSANMSHLRQANGALQVARIIEELAKRARWSIDLTDNI